MSKYTEGQRFEFNNFSEASEFQIREGKKLPDDLIMAISGQEPNVVLVKRLKEPEISKPYRPERVRSHSIIRDDLGGIHGLKSMADGKQYDSKSAYYQSVKAHGYEIVGNEKLENKKPDTGQRSLEVKQAIAETMERIGYR